MDAGGPAWLSAQGNRIVDQYGRTVVLRGVNVEHWNWVYASNPNIEFESRAIAAATGPTPDGWGANVVLLAVASGPINRNDAMYLGFIDRMVSMARANGAYTLLVYRSEEPDGDQPAMPDQAAQQAMANLAGRYANEPAVLYGLQVEPHGVTWATLKPVFTAMVDGIRVRNPRALVAVPGTNWGRNVTWALTDPIPRGNLVYKINYYDPFSAFDSYYQATALAAVFPVMLTEFGAGTQMSLGDVRRLLDTSEALGVSWIGWLFQSVACPCMLADTTTFAPTAYGQEVKDRLQRSGLAFAAAPGPVAADVALAALVNTGSLDLVSAFNYATARWEAFVPGLPGNLLSAIAPNSVLMVTVTRDMTLVASGGSFQIRANLPTPVPVGPTVSLAVGW